MAISKDRWRKPEPNAVMRAFVTLPLCGSEVRRLARGPLRVDATLQSKLSDMVAAFVASRESDHGSKARLERAREYLRSFLQHGARRRTCTDSEQPLDADAPGQMEDLYVDSLSALPNASADESSFPPSCTRNLVHDARRRRESFERNAAAQEALPTGRGLQAAKTASVPPVVASFRSAMAGGASREQLERATNLQRDADAQLLAHHDATVRLDGGKVKVTPMDDWTTLIRVHVNEHPPNLDKASLTTRTLPKLLRRKLNTLLTTEQCAPGRTTVIISEATSNAVIAIYMPGALKNEYRGAKDAARSRHYVNGGWAKGCAAEPVVSPERLAGLWNSMMRLRAYGLNERCSFIRAEPHGTSYRLIYLNRHGKECSFQMGSWIDRAQLSRDDLLCDEEYRAYDEALHDAYRRGVTAALGFEGHMQPAEIEARVGRLSLGLLASNFLDSRMRYAPLPPLHSDAHRHVPTCLNPGTSLPR